MKAPTVPGQRMAEFILEFAREYTGKKATRDLGVSLLATAAKTIAINAIAIPFGFAGVGLHIKKTQSAEQVAAVIDRALYEFLAPSESDDADAVIAKMKVKAVLEETFDALVKDGKLQIIQLALTNPKAYRQQIIGFLKRLDSEAV